MRCHSGDCGNHRLSNLKYLIAFVLTIVFIYALSTKERGEYGEYNIDASEEIWVLILISYFLLNVMTREYHSCGTDGNFIRDAAHIPIQLQYQFPDEPNHDSRPTIGSPMLCDIGLVKEGDNFQFTTYIIPHTFKRVIKPNERVKIFV